jgi:inhibitor of cysteine peptidase
MAESSSASRAGRPACSTQAPEGTSGFAKSVAFLGENVLIASREAVFLFDASTGEQLLEFDRPTTSVYFGSSLAVSGDMILVGAASYLPRSSEGTAHLYDATSGELLETFADPSPGERSAFGLSVAFAGDRVLVGSPKVGRGPEPNGAVYLFEPTTGELLETFRCPTSNSWDREEFGGLVAGGDGWVLVGTALDNVGPSSAAHLFTVSGSAEASSHTTTTDAEGNYDFGDLEPGSYQLCQVSPEGYRQTLPQGDGTYQVAVGRGGELTGLDFGDFRLGPPPPPEPGSLSGTVFEDLDGDGARDTNEPGLSYVTVQLVDSEGNYLDGTYTDADGNYAFVDISPGSYVVTSFAADGYLLTLPADETHSVALGEGEELSSVDFGFVDELGTLSRFESPEQLEQFLIEAALARYAGLFGRPGPMSLVDYRHVLRPTDPLLVRDDMPAVVAVDASYSETNVQVVGVDEGDLVETDGDYLYILSGQELVIVDARDPQALQVASRLELDDRPFAMYLAGDRLTLLSRKDMWFIGADLDSWMNPELGWFVPCNMDMTLTVLDLSDRQSPTIVQQTSVDGNFVDSRAIGNVVYLVVQQGLKLPAPELIDVGSETAGPEQPVVGSQRYETKEEYLERIEGQILDLALPHFHSYGRDGQLVESGLLSRATDVYRPAGGDANAFTSVVAFDVAGDAPGPISSVSVPSHGASQVYVSRESLYLLQGRSFPWCDQDTSIVKLDLDEATGGVELSASGKVPGRVLDQFSVDEHDGYLRIATTQGWAGRWDGQGSSGNNLYVLQQQGDRLQIVGRLEDLAPGEKIYSARFLGDRAFVVTYKKVDPLFAVDLSDPTDPRVAGELKIPGFSNYLHSIEGGYLIGIGRHADEQTGLFQDPQVSLFDVGDLSAPELLDRFTLDTGRAGGQGIFSDHHVIAYYPEHGVLTVSVPDGEGWLGGSNDLWVFHIDVNAGSQAEADGIELLSRIEHDSSVVRSVRIGDLLCAISADTVTVHAILDPATPLAELDLGAGSDSTLNTPPTPPPVDDETPVPPPDPGPSGDEDESDSDWLPPEPPPIVDDETLIAQPDPGTSRDEDESDSDWLPPEPPPIVDEATRVAQPDFRASTGDQESAPDPLLAHPQFAVWPIGGAGVRWHGGGGATFGQAAASRVSGVLVDQDDDVLNGGSLVAPVSTGVPASFPFSGGVAFDPLPDRPLAHDALFSALESGAIEFGDLELDGDGLAPALEASGLQDDAEDADD